MTTLIAVVVVGVGSLVFRLAPLLGAARLPEPVSRAAGWTGLSVLAAMAVRAVVVHDDPSLDTPRLVAAAAVAVGLLLAYHRRPLAVAVGAGAATYVLLALALR